MVPVIIGNTQRENQCLSSYALISRHWIMLDFVFFLTGFIHKVLKAKRMEDCNGLPKPTKVEAPLGTDANGSEAKRYWPNSYAYVIGMMMYLASNTRPDILFVVIQCDRFTHNTKVSHDTAVKRICRYLRCTKENVLVFNPSKKLLVGCYADADFAGLWVHKDPQDPICDSIRN